VSKWWLSRVKIPQIQLVSIVCSRHLVEHADGALESLLGEATARVIVWIPCRRLLGDEPDRGVPHTASHLCSRTKIDNRVTDV